MKVRISLAGGDDSSKEPVSQTYDVNVPQQTKAPAFWAAERAIATFREHGHAHEGTYDDRTLSIVVTR